MNENPATETLFMRRAFDLALLGKGMVSPNPMVGAVITLGDRIIAEGWHRRYGGAHAEVNAIDAVADKSVLRDCTMYVNLEPCSHFGKTPPCADLLVEHSLKKVVICNVDSNPLVAGQGIEKLRSAGIEVISGILENAGRELNKRFFTYMEKRRPYIVLKWAETADRFIARENGDSKWISNARSRMLVHKWRSEEDAVLVGRATAQSDNPLLTVRDWSGRHPVRIVIDRYLRLPRDLHVFDGKHNTICYNCVKDETTHNLSLVRIPEPDFAFNLMADLGKRNIQSVIVEGGSVTLQKFIDGGLWDEARIFRSADVFGKGMPAPTINGRVAGRQHIDRDELTILTPF